MLRHPLPFVAVASLALAACTYKPAFINEYKIDVQQGNVLTQEMVNQLKPGQTREQVRFLLGSPMVTDVFHQQRWDYPYRLQNGRTGEVEMRRMTVFFDEAGHLQRVAGDVAEATQEELSTPPATTRLVDLGTLSGDAASQPLPPRQEPGFFRRLLDMIGF